MGNFTKILLREELMLTLEETQPFSATVDMALVTKRSRDSTYKILPTIEAFQKGFPISTSHILRPKRINLALAILVQLAIVQT
jgi:hypothetical protein